MDATSKLKQNQIVKPVGIRYEVFPNVLRWQATVVIYLDWHDVSRAKTLSLLEEKTRNGILSTLVRRETGKE